ncbi:radial spoke head protein 9 homolog [Onthophagus taurus]|uniref:radial spoke head protein 9 homolog n=1 Tax=Onthophagus taurus TaxID=166361 RepID=UPI000C20E82A|nr:radial spoke head protein 9 homolog [Onthophagus taurus]
MDLDSLLDTLETTGHSGQVLSTEEGIILYNSLLLLQNENHFRKIYFWGRIFGVEKDYFLAFGYVKDALLGKIFYYSTNCIDWGLLPHPTEQGKLLTPLCVTKFHGDPALVVDILIEKDETSLGHVFHAPQIRKLKEEDRLSCTVYYINEEAIIVPRGALFKRPDGVNVENLSFEGLERLEAQEIASFLHYRIPREKWNTNLLTRSDYNYAMDFLDPIDMDIPGGCWMIQVTAGGIMQVLQSMYWPGFVFFHKIGTTKYGYAYFGHGKKVIDVPFMIPPI